MVFGLYQNDGVFEEKKLVVIIPFNVLSLSVRDFFDPQQLPFF